VLVDRKLNVSWKCVLATQKANSIVGCIKRSMANRVREVILPLCSSLLRPHLVSAVSFGLCIQHKNDMDLLE